MGLIKSEASFVDMNDVQLLALRAWIKATNNDLRKYIYWIKNIYNDRLCNRTIGCGQIKPYIMGKWIGQSTLIIVEDWSQYMRQQLNAVLLNHWKVRIPIRCEEATVVLSRFIQDLFNIIFHGVTRTSHIIWLYEWHNYNAKYMHNHMAHTHMHQFIHLSMINTPTWIHHARTRAYIHTYIHAYIHTYIHTYIHKC